MHLRLELALHHKGMGTVDPAHAEGKAVAVQPVGCDQVSQSAGAARSNLIVILMLKAFPVLGSPSWRILAMWPRT